MQFSGKQTGFHGQKTVRCHQTKKGESAAFVQKQGGDRFGGGGGGWGFFGGEREGRGGWFVVGWGGGRPKRGGRLEKKELEFRSPPYNWHRHLDGLIFMSWRNRPKSIMDGKKRTARSHIILHRFGREERKRRHRALTFIMQGGGGGKKGNRPSRCFNNSREKTGHVLLHWACHRSQ